MKRLPILFSIVLLVVSGVAAQEKPKGKAPERKATTVMLGDAPERSEEELAAMAARGYPTVPDSIMKASLIKMDGTNFNLNEYRGTAIVLQTFAVWAGPAREELLKLLEIQEKYKDSGLKIIAVSIGNGNGTPEDKKAIAKFGNKLKVNFDLVQEVSFGGMTDAINKLTLFDGVPQTILIDREGLLRGIFIGGGQGVSRSRKETVDKLMSEK